MPLNIGITILKAIKIVSVTNATHKLSSILLHFIHIIRVCVTGTVGKVVEMLQKRSNHPGVLSTWKGRLLKYSLVLFHFIVEHNQYLYGASERVGTDSALFVIKAQPDVHYNVDYVHRPPNFC